VTFNHGVLGSSPSALTINRLIYLNFPHDREFAKVVVLAIFVQVLANSVQGPFLNVACLVPI
jgi:hypothetical protein